MKIHYITPFATDKNIGREYNERISELPDDSWIVVRDGDTMFMRSDWGNQIRDIIEKHGQTYKLISCVTNRLRSTHQLYENSFSHEGDITCHVEIANELYDGYYDHVQAVTTVAGVCMIFHKDTWKDIKFEENSLRFDTAFSTAIRRKYNGGIGIAKGLYLFHLYRWGQKNPENYINHLI